MRCPSSLHPSQQEQDAAAPSVVDCNRSFSLMNIHSHALPTETGTRQAFKMCIRIITSCQQEKINSVFALESLREGR